MRRCTVPIPMEVPRSAVPGRWPRSSRPVRKFASGQSHHTLRSRQNAGFRHAVWQLPDHAQEQAVASVSRLRRWPQNVPQSRGNSGLHQSSQQPCPEGPVKAFVQSISADMIDSRVVRVRRCTADMKRGVSKQGRSITRGEASPPSSMRGATPKVSRSPSCSR